MISKNDIGCVVVIFNPDANIVENIKGYEQIVNEVILVDNSEEDNSPLFSDLSFAKYIPLMENTGIANALNVGINALSERFILTMDQDSKISDALIKAYIDYLNTNDIADIGALTPQFNTDRNPASVKAGSDEVLLSMQSGTLFKRAVFEKIGMFDAKLFLDVVDWEYFLRMRTSGYKLIRINNAILDHRPASTREFKFGPIAVKYGIAPPVRYYYQSRNLLWTARKYHCKVLYKNLMVKWLKIVLLFDNKNNYLKAFHQGIRDAKANKLGKCKENYG